MNKDFFKIDHQISLLDILEVLDISKDDLVIKNDDFVLQPEKIYIEDFVSFEKESCEKDPLPKLHESTNSETVCSSNTLVRLSILQVISTL